MTVNADKLVRMGEQVAANLRFDDDEDGLIERLADHLQRFWDPRMKAAIQEHCARERADISPALRAAVVRMSRE